MPTDFDAVRRRLSEFRDARGWRRYHTPRNLSMALASEVGEVLAEMRWATDDEILSDAHLRGAVEEELADVGIFLILLCDALDVDLLDAMMRKIDLNESRFPAPEAG